ncbi:hypothetical protein [Streptomyces silaceus]|uniref:hypothetical protein n=1 Tax=Streptomyces silaceus TaxID=545123 RepID=UPI0006EB5BDA|nr:hypothetical protein [Streptomyces silaceus]
MHRVELSCQADAVMVMLPDDVHEEVLAVIDSVADAPDTRPGPVVAFGVSSWVTCRAARGTVEVLDVGWTD